MATETNTCIRDIEVEIPAERVEKETKRVTKEFARLARLPGFRPGKAPPEIVRRRFWEDIKGEVLHSLIPPSLENAIQEQKLAPVGNPSIAELDFQPDKPLRYKATLEVMPEIELKDYKGLEVEPARLQLTEEDVERELQGLRERAARFDKVDRPARTGDVVVASLTGIVVEPKEKRDPLRLEDVRVQLGSEGTLEGFTEGLRDAREGEERKFMVTYPEDFSEETLAGRRVEFTARVKAVEEKKIPELNDDFAQQLGEYKSLEEVKSRLREQLEQARAQREKDLTRQRLFDKLLEKHDFPVPEALVERQLDALLERQVRTLMMQGIDPRQVSVDWERLRRDQREQALREVRVNLLLERIAQAENIQASQEEVEQEIERLAHGSGQTPEAVRARLTKEDGLARIDRAVRSGKVVEFLLSETRG